MQKYITLISTNKGIKVLVIFITLDVIFGVLRALREKKLNSTIGIDGIIRKVGMFISIIFSIILDDVLNINLIGFIPEELRNYFPMQNIGIAFLFNSLYCIFETLSVLKNMIKCKMPIPKKVQAFLEKILKEFTSEIKENEVK